MQELQHNLHPTRNISELIFGKLSESNNFLEGIMRAEIHIMNGDLLKAAEMLAIISEKVKWHDLIEQVILYRMRKYIESRFADSQITTIAYEADYRAFLDF